MKALILFPLLLVSVRTLTDLNVLFEWKELALVWPNETFKNWSTIIGDWVPEHNIPLGVAVWENKVFMTIPRWRVGIPASLVYFDLNTTENSPDLIPYPGWENHDFNNLSNQTIVNPPRINIDVCNRMWLVDFGLSTVFEIPTRITPPSLLVIDLETDLIIRRYELGINELYANFAYLVIDVDKNNCDDAYAYVTDPGNNILIVYSYGQNISWVFSHSFFYFEPLHGNYWFQGLNFQFTDGIYGAALGPRENDGYRTLYFHPLVSNNEFSVSTRTLRNQSLAFDNDYYLWTHEGYKGQHACSLISAFDETTNTLITGQFEQYAVGCWNPKQQLNPSTIHLVAQDNDTIAFPSDLKIDADRNLWILTDRLPFFLFSTLNFNETNFRILTTKIDDLIAGTGCEVQ